MCLDNLRYELMPVHRGFSCCSMNRMCPRAQFVSLGTIHTEGNRTSFPFEEHHALDVLCIGKHIHALCRLGFVAAF